MILKTQAELENYNLVNRVFHLDKDTYLFGGLEGNVAQPFTVLNNNYERPDFMKFDDINRIHDVIVRMAGQGKFLLNKNYVDIFNLVFGDEQFKRKDTGAARDWVIGELVKRGEWPPTTETVAQILIDSWNQLLDNAEFRENKAETDKRSAQIAEMTGNGEHGFSIQRGPRKTAYDKTGRVHDPMHGQAQGFSMGISGPWSRGAGSKSFEEMTNEEVDSLFREWQATETYKNMSTEDLRKLVRSNGATDVFGKNKTVPIVAAPSDRQLINPATGAQFTQRELHRYATDFPQDARKMISDPNTGRMIPWKKDLFERIWRGELQ